MVIRSVGELIRGRVLHTIDVEATVTEVCRRLHEHHIGALAVEEGGALIGIISERDVIARVIAAGLDPQLTLVRAAMTPDPRTIGVEECLADALQKMLDGHFRHLPVMHDGKVTGMISMRDIQTEYRLMRQRYEEMLARNAAAGQLRA
ncbi:CBS domain-containing protein [Methylorubrum extorquens]|uniref:CBS domain-containing protein n=1 Tax=Methylorubrum extorquens TaxID=408 RepID=UPI002237569F|nr:CBS domain-containing protein [Methylorubrum extorquens]UYW26622.1 CBS domain-containing protein [Methylorubrum extorquens]